MKKIFLFFLIITWLLTSSITHAWVSPDKNYNNSVIWEFWDDSFWYVGYSWLNSKYYQIDFSVSWTKEVGISFNADDIYSCNVPYTWTMFIYWSSTWFTINDNMYCILESWDWIISNNSTLEIFNTSDSIFTVNITTITPPTPPAPPTISSNSSFSWVTLVTTTQASNWSSEVVSAIIVLVSAIVALGWFFITKYFGNRIIAFLERVLNR